VLLHTYVYNSNVFWFFVVCRQEYRQNLGKVNDSYFTISVYLVALKFLKVIFLSITPYRPVGHEKQTFLSGN